MPTSGLTGLVQITFLAWAGFTVGLLLGWSRVESLFLGACLCISSTMLVSKVFAQQPVDPDVRDHVLGVLVIQDVAAIALIAAMTGVAAGGGLEPGALALTLLRLAGVLLGLLAGGMLVVPRLVRRVVRLGSAEVLAVTAVGLCFGMALLAHALGYSVALGAFIAGMLVAESGEGAAIEHLLAPLRDIFAAIFFVSIGMGVEPAAAWDTLGTSLVVTAVVVSAQFVSVTGAGVLSGLGQRRSVIAALALGQIGEFAFILAGIGVVAGVVRPTLLPIVVTVAILTAFTTPLLLRNANRVARAIDHRTPRRVQQVLSLYEAWIQRARSSAPDQAWASARRRALRALALDTAALLVLGALTAAWFPQASAAIAGRLGVSGAAAGGGIAVLLLLLGSPLAAGVVRNGDVLARHLAEQVAPEGGANGPGERAAAAALRAMVHLAIALSLGAPAIAVMRPLIGGPYGIAVLALTLTTAAWLAWRAAGDVDQQLRSGTGRMVARLAAQAAPSADLSRSRAVPPAGVMQVVSLVEGDAAVGCTLAEVDLRARTGATVVAIRRQPDAVILPSGREVLAAGDALDMVGTEDAFVRAAAVLRHGS